jgi:hypothetical protein
MPRPQVNLLTYSMCQWLNYSMIASALFEQATRGFPPYWYVSYHDLYQISQ